RSTRCSPLAARCWLHSSPSRTSRSSWASSPQPVHTQPPPTGGGFLHAHERQAAMALRNINITFGLVSFAAKLDVAREKAPETRNLCTGQPGKAKHDPSLLKQPSTCDSCGEITDRSAL